MRYGTEKGGSKKRSTQEKVKASVSGKKRSRCNGIFFSAGRITDPFSQYFLPTIFSVRTIGSRHNGVKRPTPYPENGNHNSDRSVMHRTCENHSCSSLPLSVPQTPRNLYLSVSVQSVFGDFPYPGIPPAPAAQNRCTF